jgi:hypothetical protein
MATKFFCDRCGTEVHDQASMIKIVRRTYDDQVVDTLQLTSGKWELCSGCDRELKTFLKELPQIERVK